MLVYSAELTGFSDLMFGKHVPGERDDKETHEQYAQRTWTQKVGTNTEGQLQLSPFALKNCLESAAAWLSRKIPGEGKKTFTKRFKSAIIVESPLLLSDSQGNPLTIEDVEPIELFVPSNGQRDGSTRVIRIFPTVHEWATTVELIGFDDKITGDVMRDHLIAAGRFIGFGPMRVQNGGINGRFLVSNFQAVENKELELMSK